MLEFNEVSVNKCDFDAAAVYLGDPYIQHRADIASDPDSLRAFNVSMRERYPQLHADVHRVFIDESFVVLHARGRVARSSISLSVSAPSLPGAYTNCRPVTTS